MDISNNFEGLDKLEKKISRTVEKIAALRDEKNSLKAEIEELKQTNIELSQQINHLKIKEEQYMSSFNREEVRRKIDHMLEKFGELQL
jgi:FtsZ-binding cell division protein ZapB